MLSVPRLYRDSALCVFCAAGPLLPIQTAIVQRHAHGESNRIDCVLLYLWSWKSLKYVLLSLSLCPVNYVNAGWWEFSLETLRPKLWHLYIHYTHQSTHKSKTDAGLYIWRRKKPASSSSSVSSSQIYARHRDARPHVVVSAFDECVRRGRSPCTYNMFVC